MSQPAMSVTMEGQGDALLPQAEIASDELLCKLAVDGPACEEAINELAAGSLGALVISRLRYLTGFNDEAAKDLAQETWLHIWKARGTWTPTSGGAVVQFVLTVARNVCHESNRADKRRIRREETAFLAADATNIDLDLAIDLEAALSHLDPSDRSLLLRAYQDGRTDAELAMELGIKVPAAKKRRQQALKRLRAFYVNPSSRP